MNPLRGEFPDQNGDFDKAVNVTKRKIKLQQANKKITSLSVRPLISEALFSTIYLAHSNKQSLTNYGTYWYNLI